MTTEGGREARAIERVARLAKLFSQQSGLLEYQGRVTTISNQHAEIQGLSRFLRVGDYVCFGSNGHEQTGEIIKIDEHQALATLQTVHGDITVGAPARLNGPLLINPCRSWLGRTINAFGHPIDGLGPLEAGPDGWKPDGAPPAAMKRQRVGRRIATGVRAIDLFTPVCEGQRIGLFAGSGVGKSTLLGMISQSLDFDITVVALVGERSREVVEFVEDIIGSKIDRTIVVVSTSDESAMARRLAPRTATAIAEYFREQGKSVCLVVDSVARFAQAERDVAISSGELPIARGFPPSVLASIARLLERSGPGTSNGGSITAFYTILVDGDDHNDPIADHIRGTLDGHIVLTRTIAEKGRYPAVDVLKSISRLARSLWSPEEALLIGQLRELISLYEDSNDLRLIGGYVAGRNPALDQAVALVPRLYDFLTQAEPDPRDHNYYGQIAALLSTTGSQFDSAGKAIG